MAKSRELISAIDELEALLGQSAAIPDASSVEGRKQALVLRRKIAGQNAIIASLGDPAFTENDKKQTFRTEISRLRSAVNSHLSCWPIATMDLSNPEYQESLARLRQAYRDFISRLRQELHGRSD